MKTPLYLPFLLASVLLIAPGCFHATVVTDRARSDRVVEDLWAHSFIGGLVPPATVDVSEQCINGVAVVETQHTFPNLVAQAVTFSLYSPMTITVTCAAGGASVHLMPRPDVEFDGITIPRHATDAGINRAFYMAAMQAAEAGEPVAVQFAK
jgi:hypothetical protein